MPQLRCITKEWLFNHLPALQLTDQQHVRKLMSTHPHALLLMLLLLRRVTYWLRSALVLADALHPCHGRLRQEHRWMLQWPDWCLSAPLASRWCWPICCWFAVLYCMPQTVRRGCSHKTACRLGWHQHACFKRQWMYSRAAGQHVGACIAGVACSCLCARTKRNAALRCMPSQSCVQQRLEVLKHSCPCNPTHLVLTRLYCAFNFPVDMIESHKIISEMQKDQKTVADAHDTIASSGCEE